KILRKMIDKERIAEAYQQIQDEICAALETLDGKAKFEEEVWEREGGGGGRTRVIQGGAILEKGGVNFSAVHGQLPDIVKKSFGVDEDKFFATGVSIVLHPHNPHVPIIHKNVRYFEITPKLKTKESKWWFGGGIDLTPHYVAEEDARFFHNQLKSVCDKHDSSYYPKFKRWADDYFFISHRNETRGIGGIFFDHLNDKDKTTLFDFVKSVGYTFAPVYTALM